MLLVPRVLLPRVLKCPGYRVNVEEIKAILSIVFSLKSKVGNGGLDHAYWGRPEDMTMARPAYKITQAKPGSDLAAETAAALAAASIAFMTTDSDYARTLVRHARELYELADLYRGKYSDSIQDAGHYYRYVAETFRSLSSDHFLRQ